MEPKRSMKALEEMLGDLERRHEASVNENKILESQLQEAKQKIQAYKLSERISNQNVDWTIVVRRASVNIQPHIDFADPIKLTDAKAEVRLRELMAEILREYSNQ